MTSMLGIWQNLSKLQLYKTFDLDFPLLETYTKIDLRVCEMPCEQGHLLQHVHDSKILNT